MAGHAAAAGPVPRLPSTMTSIPPAPRRSVWTAILHGIPRTKPDWCCRHVAAVSAIRSVSPTPTSCTASTALPGPAFPASGHRVPGTSCTASARTDPSKGPSFALRWTTLNTCVAQLRLDKARPKPAESNLAPHSDFQHWARGPNFFFFFSSSCASLHYYQTYDKIFMLFIFLRVFPHFSVRFSFLLNSGHHRGGQSQNEHNTIPLFSQTIIFSRACTSEALFALPLFFSSLQPTNVLLAKLFFFLGASIQWPLGHSFFSVAPQNDPRGTQAPPWGIFHLTVGDKIIIYLAVPKFALRI